MTDQKTPTSLGSRAGFVLRLGRYALGGLVTMFIVPLVEYLANDRGYFGGPDGRLRPLFSFLGHPTTLLILTAVFSAVAGFWFGRGLLGVWRTDGPDARFKVSSPEELQRLFNLSIVAHFFQLWRGETPVSELKKMRAGFAEECQAAAILLVRWLQAKGCGRIIAVTGDRPGVGKSTTAFGLAVGLSRRGAKVLLIDGDLRNPSLHRVVGVANQHGLSGLSTDTIAGGDAIVCLDEWGIDFLPSGSRPLVPSQTITNQLHRDVLDRLAGLYDYVLIDTAPFALSDTLEVCSVADAVLFVIGHGNKLVASRRTLERVRQDNPAPVALVFTRVPTRQRVIWGGYDYAYDYNYGAVERQATTGPAPIEN